MSPKGRKQGSLGVHVIDDPIHEYWREQQRKNRARKKATKKVAQEEKKE